MTLNCELGQSEFSVLSGNPIIKFSKTCFLCTYVDKMIIQPRLMFCSKFSFTMFLLIFFLLLSNVFTDILKIDELPKIYNKIPKYCQTLVSTIIIYHANSQCHNFIWLLNYTPINFIENVPLAETGSFDSK